MGCQESIEVKNDMHTVRSMKAMAVLTAAALFCAGCSDKTTPTVNDMSSNAVSGETQNTEDTSNSSDSEKTVKSIDEIYQEIEQSVSLQSPQRMDEDFILNYYGIDVTTLEEYVFSMSEDAAQAETIVIMKVSNSEDLEEFADCLQTIVDDKKSEMENYIPEQFAIVEKSRVRTKDDYIWLVISDNADKITDVIESGLF